MRWLERSAACLAAGLALWLWCCAASASAVELGANVPGHSDLTYFDLMKLVVTDLKKGDKGEAAGSDVVAFNHIDTTQEKPDIPDIVVVQAVEAMTIPDDQSRVVLLADLGRAEGLVANIQLLALFAVSPAPRLFDVVAVGTDRFTSLRTGTPGMLAPKTPLILVDNSHWNSNRNYLSTEIIFIGDDHFRLIDSLFTLSDHTCASTRTQEPSIKTGAAAGHYRTIDVVVTDRTAATGEDCGEEKPPRPQVSTYRASYRWDERQQRFVTQSKALQRLSKINEKRL